MYCRSGQSTEEEMYNNEHGSPAFVEFLDLIGKKVKLKGFEKFKGGLDNKSKYMHLLCHHDSKCALQAVRWLINSMLGFS